MEIRSMADRVGYMAVLPAQSEVAKTRPSAVDTAISTMAVGESTVIRLRERRVAFAEVP